MKGLTVASVVLMQVLGAAEFPLKLVADGTLTIRVHKCSLHIHHLREFLGQSSLLRKSQP